MFSDDERDAVVEALEIAILADEGMVDQIISDADIRNFGDFASLLTTTRLPTERIVILQQALTKVRRREE